MSRYLITIGLETHVQLKTATKMFCGCSLKFGDEPNTNVCPVCLGYPGALPVMNREAVRLTVLSGLMLGCRIGRRSHFDRKNYFYPDMSKDYQISQNGEPLCLGGGVTVETPQGPKRIRINHIHLEEDAAKITHYARFSGVDFNRCGTPLMEIVSEPDLSSPDEALAYLQALKQTLMYAGVSDCNLEEGNMRSDVNISVRPEGQEALGTKVEIKNMNTFKGICAALEYEIARQLATVTRGGSLVQETRRWDPDLGETQSMRSKENAHDYRYFPEPDLVPVELSEEQVEAWRAQLPEAPAARRERMMAEYGIPAYDAGVLADAKANADFFEAAARACKPGLGKTVSNWFMTEVMRLLSETGKTVGECALTPGALAELVGLVDDGVINGPTAKELLPELYAKGGSPRGLVEARGLAQVSDVSALEAFVAQVFAGNAKSVEDFRAGKKAAAGFLVGQVMKLSKGKADPKQVGRLVAEKLAEAPGGGQ
ncbi:MAG: Asp-tRNA(Asn)/Glu-tRNA(Gln) amidotransferase subunit GatB [Verrucomicrobiota bacterium]|jgi:aspartyl-tRNA(Asn)/glutamyl-tRNA(Gln) amidotransferase subunit B|nr:Asp-tRNA(Asn)/Glu-tRNA(Gln) amidotransferase subunit GatB [Verrucomicrobiota bacterium]